MKYKLVLEVKDVMELCRCSRNRAYEMMREVNEEMKKEKLITTSGKVNTSRFLKRLGISKEDFKDACL